MSKLNQIQSALKEIGDASFQKLADAYLHKKGYNQINSLGSVIGTDKVRKGTPDTLIPLPNGKYVFAEHTTQQSGLNNKLEDDLANCFDEKKTGIPISKIAEVVFCYTSELSSEEIDGLRNQCQNKEVNLSLFGISRISYDILLKYPFLAHEFLNIEIDTGQILEINEFISAYNKNILAPPLDTTFYFREDELKNVVDLLESKNLVIIGGRPGVGKSRFAIECLKEFSKKNAKYQIRCIFNRGPDIFTDLRHHFSAPGLCLIFVDDANRINKFEYILQLIHNNNESRIVKIIATVRDYAVEKIMRVAREYDVVEYQELNILSKEQIKQLVEKELDCTLLLRQ
jgi:Cdc6-like AAA superfamily ATPase